MPSSAVYARPNVGAITIQAYNGSGVLINPAQTYTKVWKTIGLKVEDIVARVKQGNGQTTKACTVRADHSFDLEANFYDNVNADPLLCPNGPQQVSTWEYGPGGGVQNLLSSWQDFDIAVDIESQEVSGGSEKWTFHQAHGRSYSGSVRRVIPLSTSPRVLNEIARLISATFADRKVELRMVIGGSTFTLPIHLDQGEHSVDDIQEGRFSWTNDGDPVAPALGNTGADIVSCAFGGTALVAVSINTGVGVYTGDCLIQRLALQVGKTDVIALSSRLVVQNGWVLNASS